MSEDRMILPESPEAAQLVTVTFWQARDGGYYEQKDEGLARWAGATHIHCEDCGKPIRKNGWIVCSECGHKRDAKRWADLEKKPWDGTTPICIMGSDTYFFNEDDLAGYCEEHDVQPNDLLLMHCRPAKPREIDASDYFCDELPEDGDDSCLPQDIIDAVKVLNKAIRSCPPLSWYEGTVAVDVMAKPAEV